MRQLRKAALKALQTLGQEPVRRYASQSAVFRVVNVNDSAQQTLVANAGLVSVSAGWNG